MLRNERNIRMSAARNEFARQLQYGNNRLNEYGSVYITFVPENYI